MKDVLRVKKALVFSMLLLSGLAAPAAASSIFWSSVTVRLGEDCPLVSSGGLPWSGCHFLRTAGINSTLGAGLDTVGPYTATFFPANGFATASIVDGTLHASAVSGTASDPLNTTGFAWAIFYDTFVPISATLAPGTPVTFAFDQQLSYTLSGECGNNTASLFSNIFLNDNFSNPVRHVSASTCTGLSHTGTGFVQGVIGQEFSIRTELSVLTLAQTLQTSADAGNSFRLIVRPLGDFGFTTASGNTYQAAPSAVPEPGSLGLLGIGLLAIATRFRRRPTKAE